MDVLALWRRPTPPQSLSKYSTLASGLGSIMSYIRSEKYYSIYSVRGEIDQISTIHPDIPPAAQKRFSFCLHIDWGPYSTFKCHLPVIYHIFI